MQGLLGFFWFRVSGLGFNFGVFGVLDCAHTMAGSSASSSRGPLPMAPPPVAPPAAEQMAKAVAPLPDDTGCKEEAESEEDGIQEEEEDREP